MRRYVLMGVALLAALWTGSNFPGLAAPVPSILRTATEPVVDVELVLAVDISRSMDVDELALQREGYAEAIISKEFLSALRSGINGKIAITYFEWAGSWQDKKIVVPWQVIDGPESADAVAAAIMAAPIGQASRTSISSAISFATELFDKNNQRGLRRVIDISGDGPNNDGDPVTAARDSAIAKGITINGLPIMIKPASGSMFDIEKLDIYYEDCVIGGSGSFVVPIKSKDKFKDAIRTKLVLEVANRMPEVRLRHVSAAEPRISCLIGEQRRYRWWGEP